MTYIIIYNVGFILTLIFFVNFGKKIGFDYDPPHDDDYDDWENNAHAYTAFSIFWFTTMTVLFVRAIWIILTKITEKLIKLWT